MKTITRTNTNPCFTEKLIINNGYILIHSGTKHSGLGSIKSSIKTINKLEAVIWLYKYKYDQAFIIFPELQNIVDNIDGAELSDIEYECRVEDEIRTSNIFH